jgi:hypothetical protein
MSLASAVTASRCPSIAPRELSRAAPSGRQDHSCAVSKGIWGSDRSSTLNEVKDHHDDHDDQQDVDKAAADGNHDDPQQPQNQQDQRDCEQHSNSFNGWMLALL